MREEWASSVAPISTSSQGLTRSSGSLSSNSLSLSMASKAMRLKLSGKLTREVSERRQVGDAVDMVNQGGETPWWKSVGMEEGL